MVTKSHKDRVYPVWVCSECGDRYGRRECGIATWHRDTCGVCGQDDVMCTEPRDFGHLKPEWIEHEREDECA